LEFLWGGADGAAVIGVGNFPENRVGIASVDAARVLVGFRLAVLGGTAEAAVPT